MESQSARNVNGNALAKSGAGSDVLIMDHNIMEAVAQSCPPIQSVSVTKCSQVHLGPKIVNVTQNVDNTQVVKGRILGLELVSPQNPRRLRCSIAVFVCWALVVACALAFVILRYASNTDQTRLDIGLTEPWYLRRVDWQALPAYQLILLELPVPHVMIGHSALQRCTEKFSCIRHMLEIQQDHLTRGWDDIGPNFFISASGLLFEGRGANVLSTMVRSWNRNSISIMFLGDYTHDESTDIQFEHVNILLKELVRLNVLKPDYTLLGHCQVVGAIYAPGRNIMDKLQKFEHWDPTNKKVCLQ